MLLLTSKIRRKDNILGNYEKYSVLCIFYIFSELNTEEDTTTYLILLEVQI